MRAKKFNKCIDMLCAGDDNGLKDLHKAYFRKIIRILMKNGKSQLEAEIIATAFFEYIRVTADEIGHDSDPDRWVEYFIKRI